MTKMYLTAPILDTSCLTFCGFQLIDSFTRVAKHNHSFLGCLQPRHQAKGALTDFHQSSVCSHTYSPQMTGKLLPCLDRSLNDKYEISSVIAKEGEEDIW